MRTFFEALRWKLWQRANPDLCGWRYNNSVRGDPWWEYCVRGKGHDATHATTMCGTGRYAASEAFLNVHPRDDK